jgi:hypothetical protein
VGPTCQTPLSAPGLPGSAPLPRGCHVPRRTRALNALSGPRAGVPTAPRRSDWLSEPPRLAPSRPRRRCCPKPRRRPCLKLVAVRPSPPSRDSSTVSVAGPPPATVAPPRRKNAAAEPVFSPSTRSSGELFSPSPNPVGSLTAVGARPPPFAPPPPLWHRRQPRRDARPESGDRSDVCHAVAGRTGRGRPGKRRPRAAPMGCASAVNAGRARCVRGPSRCHERGPACTVHLGRAWFRPSGSRFKFSIF